MFCRCIWRRARAIGWRCSRSCCALGFCVVLFVLCTAYWYEAWSKDWHSDTVWRARLWIPYLAMPVGLGLLVLQYLAELICLVTGRAPPFGLRRKGRRGFARVRPASAGRRPMTPTCKARSFWSSTLLMLVSGIPGGVRPRRDLDHFSADLPGLRQHARRRRDLLFGPRRFHAGRHPDVRDDGRGDRLVAGRQGSLRSARPLALSPARRPGDFQPRRLRDFRRADRFLAGLLRGHRQDGHSGNAPARLSGRGRHRFDLRRRHARHSDPAVDHLHPLRHRHRDLDRPPVHRRRDARPHADRPVHAVDDVHHLAQRLPLARRRFSLFVEGKIPVDPEDRAVPRSSSSA